MLNWQDEGEPKAGLRERRTRAAVQQFVSKFPAAACGGMNFAAVDFAYGPRLATIESVGDPGDV